MCELDGVYTGWWWVVLYVLVSGQARHVVPNTYDVKQVGDKLDMAV